MYMTWNRYTCMRTEVEKGGGGGGDLFSIPFCMCGYLFVFTTILNKMKMDKEFVKCISVKSSMGISNSGIYLLTGIESTHGLRFRCLVTLHRPIRVENPPAFGSTSFNFNASKLLSSLIEIITHKTLKFLVIKATFVYGAILFLLFTTKRKQVDYF